MFHFKSSYLLPALALTFALAAPQSAHAQPDPNNAPKADNPNNRPARPNNLRAQQTPEQREEMIKRFMKNQIERAGVTDDAQQDAVVEYIQGEMDARQDLQDSSQTLSTALRNTTLSDAQVAGLLNTYLGQVDDDRSRRTAAQKTLKGTVDMLKFPRLESMLALMGAWDDAPVLGGNNWMGRGRNRADRAPKNDAAKPGKKANNA